MSEFSYETRQTVMQEAIMWAVLQMLKDESDVENCWQSRIRALAEEVGKIARELRDFNDQFEGE
jgi:hypothetical protein